MKRLTGSPFLKAVSVLASGTALAQLITIAITPVISRLFSPDDFGVLGLFNAYLGMTASIAGLSFPLAIVTGVPKREAAQLTMLGLFVTLPVSTILTLVLWILMRFELLGYGEFTSVGLVSVWIALMLVGAFQAFRYWHLREGQYRMITSATISQSVARTVALIPAGFASLGGAGLILAEVVRRSAGVTMMARQGWPEVRESAQGTSRSDLWEVAKTHKKFPLLSTPSSFINSLALALPAPLLVSTYGLSASGQFSMAYSVMALPISIIGSAVADVFQRQVAQLAPKGSAAVRRLFLRVALILFLSALFPSIIVMLWGGEIFKIILGSQWELAGVIASGIMPWLLMSFVLSPLSRIVFVFRGQELKLIYDVISFVGIVLGVYVGSSLDFSIDQTVRILGFTQAFAYLVYFVLLLRIIRSIGPVDASDG